MRRVRQWAAQHPFVSALLVLLVVAIPGFVRVEQIADDQQRLLDCTTEWANALAARSGRLSGLVARRADALDELVRAVAVEDPTRFAAALRVYLQVSDAYQDALANNPPPPPPRLRC